MDAHKLKGLLVKWGYYFGRQAAADGYPPESSILHIFSGSRSRPASKILVMDMPGHIWEVEHAIQKLKAEHRLALIAHYALPPHDDGSQRTIDDLAKLLHLRPEAYRKRVYRARKELLRTLDVSHL